MLNRSRKNLRRDVGRAYADFDMIQDGDLVMVCLSGGKDSTADISSLRAMPYQLQLHAVNLDRSSRDFRAYSQVFGKSRGDTKFWNKTPTRLSPQSACGENFVGFVHGYAVEFSYNYAESIGANKIALGHHRDIVKPCFSTCFMAAS